MDWQQILGVVVFVLVTLFVWQKAQYRREVKQFYAELKAMNRGKMDQPGWTQKPWQHEPGECKKHRMILDAEIETYHRKITD